MSYYVNGGFFFIDNSELGYADKDASPEGVELFNALRDAIIAGKSIFITHDTAAEPRTPNVVSAALIGSGASQRVGILTVEYKSDGYYHRKWDITALGAITFLQKASSIS